MIRIKLLLWLILIGGILVYPLVVPPFWATQIGAQSIIYGIIALSIVLLAAYGGMISLAQVAIGGFAAYLYCLTTVNNANIGIPLPWPLTILVALIGGTLAGALIGLISVRTRGVYCLMITLAISYGFFLFVRGNWALFNGWDGFARVKPPMVFGVDWRSPVPFYYLCLACATCMILGSRHLVQTLFGLSLQGLRDADRRLQALGYWPGLHRVAAFGIAGFIAAVGGILSLWYHSRISPGSVDLTRTFNVMVVAVIGGLSHHAGAFLGAMLFTLVDNFAIDFIDRERFNTLIGLVFMAVLLFSPDGLVGLWRRLKGYVVWSKVR